MDLLSGQPYWFYKNGNLNTYPGIEEDQTADVAIMGGGITGSLMAWYLTQAGCSVIVLEKRHIGLGSTSGSTALLQYEIDNPLTELIELVGEKNAVRSYLLCVEAISKVQQIVKKLKKDVSFSRKKSIYYASKKSDLKDLEKEYKARTKIGINVDWWDQEKLQSKFPHINKSGAILSHDAAQVDAYQFAHALLQDCIQNGAKVYDTATVVNIDTNSRGVALTLDNNKKVKAKKLVIASGYEAQDYISKKVTRLHSTYAVISKPISQKEDLWYENSLLWESARPYLYVRTTEDKRILIGGKDEMFQSAVKRDKLMNLKSKQLVASANKLFPDLPFIKDYEWCGTFAETKDGLPLIGSVKQYENTYFALGFGGNGILFSVIASQIITDLIKKKKNEDSSIFEFARL